MLQNRPDTEPQARKLALVESVTGSFSFSIFKETQEKMFNPLRLLTSLRPSFSQLNSCSHTWPCIFQRSGDIMLTASGN